MVFNAGIVPIMAISVAVTLSAAQAAPLEESPELLDSVVVVASRVAEPRSQVVGSVSVLERDVLDLRMVQDISDLVRYEPGVVAIGDATRFGLQGYSIRGLDGNRVRIELDGVPVADSFGVGNFSLAGRDLVDTEIMQRVEILRGPASTLYGSDALAGIISYRTRDPADFLAMVGGDHYLGARVGYASRDHSRLGSATWASSAGDWQALVSVAQRSGEQTENASDIARYKANPRDYTRSSLLAKVMWDGDMAGQWAMTLDHGRGRADTDVRSLVGGPGQFASTERMETTDRERRDRLSVTSTWSPGWSFLETLDLLAYTQRTDVEQHADQWRGVDGRTRYPTLRERDFELAQNARGVRLMGQARGDWAGASHWQVFGVEYGRTRYDEMRDGLEYNLLTGQSTPIIIGETMPVRDFPLSTAQQLAAFWQDEIRFGKFALVPGLRWERYRLDAHPDAIFTEDNPGVVPADISSNSLTPKLGFRMAAGANGSVFAQYTRGYRAPPFGDVNVGFTIPAFNYITLPNPDLRAEKSNGFEVGYRYEQSGRRLEVSVYDNRYRDLIESRARIGTDPDTGALVFQSVNRDRARIRGIELAWSQELGSAAGGDWSTHAAAAWSRGEDTARDVPLNSVQPARGVLGLHYQRDRWGVELVGSAVGKNDRVDSSEETLFIPPGYATFDLLGWVQLASQVRLHAGVFNLTDRKYWEWSAARAVNEDFSDRDFFTATGINASIGLNVYW